MSTPKGYPSQEKESRTSPQFSTIEPVRTLQNALSVLSHMFVEDMGSDLVEANSTESVIVATAHAARRGDVIRFEAGALSGYEVKVWAVTANEIELAEELPSAPALGVSFEILRHRYPRIDNLGGAASTFQFVRDGAAQQVVEDTAVPANNIPLPVKLTGVTGDLIITAQNLNIQSTHTGANPDSMQIGDGTDLLAISAAGEASVVDSAARTSLASVDGKLPASLGAKLSAASLSVVLASDQAALPITDNGGSLTIDNANLDVALSTLATQATLAAMSAKLPATLGQKAMAASLAVVIASDQGALPVVMGAGMSAIDRARNDYAASPVSTAAYVQLIAATAAAIKEVEIFDSSGQTLVLAVGGAGVEVDQVYVLPGGNGRIPLSIASGARVSIKAVSALADVGEFTANFYG